VVKCVDWSILTSRTNQTQLPAEHVRDTDILLHIAVNADIVLSAEVITCCCHSETTRKLHSYYNSLSVPPDISKHLSTFCTLF